MAETQDTTTAVWDFAYSTGACGLPTSKVSPLNMFTTEDSETNRQPPTPRKQQRSESGKSFSSIITNGFHPASSTTAEACNDAGKSNSLKWKIKTKAKAKSKHHRQDRQEPQQSQRTYLLSIPHADRVYCNQMKESVSTLLLTPHTQVVLLVPQSHIVCPRMCELGRLPKAIGSGLRILPVPAEILMECSSVNVIEYHDKGSENSMYFENQLEMLAVQEIAAKVVRCTKVKHFDGYLAFEDDRASWVFLERVGKTVAGLSSSGGRKA